MSKQARNPKSPNAWLGRGGRDQPEYKRFCTDWYIPESSVTTGYTDNEAPEPMPRARRLLPDALAGRVAIRTVNPIEDQPPAPGTASAQEVGNPR